MNKEEENKVFHGSCLNCTSQRDYGIKRCNYCKYKEFDHQKPDISINDSNFRLYTWIENKKESLNDIQNKNLKTIKIISL